MTSGGTISRPMPKMLARDGEVDEQDRDPAGHPSAVEPVDRRGDRDREEDRDQEQADDVPDQVGEVEAAEHRGDDQHDLGHRRADTCEWSIAGQPRRDPDS